MKATSNPKHSSLHVEFAAPSATKTSAALKTGTPTRKPGRETANRPPSARGNGHADGHFAASMNRADATATPVARAAEKASRTRVSSASSAEAAKSDRVTLLAFYTLFGAMLAGLIYFVALVFAI